MNTYAIIFMLVNAGALVSFPRHLATLPLIVGACYMPISQGINIGAFSFPVIRMLIAVGIFRVLMRGEWIEGGMNRLDWLMIAFAAWALASSYFHLNPTSALVFRLGLVFNTCGIYFLLRIFFKSPGDVWGMVCITAILLTPVAFEMVYEHIRLHNLFSFFGGVPSIPEIREGNIRAQGPFRHAILAGTVGAVCFPLMVSVWNQHRKTAMLGILACTTMVVASSSSGPLASYLMGIGGLLMWRYRQHMNLIRWVAVIGYVALDIVMKAPAYYLMSRIPIVTGSSGWHRARLIETAINHLNEWWLSGTDYTRHWMPTGVSWNPDHTDITNHYLEMGVIGGVPLMILFVLTLAKAFSFVGQSVNSENHLLSDEKFMVWAFGSSLFANAATMISVSYFDQSFIFLYLTLAVIGSVRDGENIHSVIK